MNAKLKATESGQKTVVESCKDWTSDLWTIYIYIYVVYYIYVYCILHILYYIILNYIILYVIILNQIILYFFILNQIIYYIRCYLIILY